MTVMLLVFIEVVAKIDATEKLVTVTMPTFGTTNILWEEDAGASNAHKISNNTIELSNDIKME